LDNRLYVVGLAVVPRNSILVEVRIDTLVSTLEYS
jgi:hypothetical protein